MGIFDKFKSGFKKSASAFTSGLRDIVVKKEIDDKTLDRIEEYLIQSDVGIVAASEIKEIISDSKIDPKKDIAEEIHTILKEYIISLMKPLENNTFFKKKEKINATLVSGVNGVGKTTTIGKISKILKANGNKVMLAASDTFRAAAIEQLENVPDVYRLVPTEGKILKPIKIKESEKSKKIVRVTSKSTINKGKMQIGFHDGRSIISDTKVNVGDSCLIQIPDVKIIEVIKLETGVNGLVTRGINSGQTGKIEAIENGTFILPKRVILTLGERKIEIPADIIMPIGKEEPIIQIK